jgi:hypothetical protein
MELRSERAEQAPPRPTDINIVDIYLADGFALLDSPPSLRNRMDETFRAGDDFVREAPEEKILNRRPLDTGYRLYGQEYSSPDVGPDEVEPLLRATECLRPTVYSVS